MENDEESNEHSADTEATVACPYCGEANDIALDPGGASVQEYVEDCHVCCRPWQVRIRWRRNGSAEVRLDPLDQ